MKKTVIFLALAFLSLGSYAQTDSDPEKINKWIEIYEKLNSTSEWEHMITRSKDCKKEVADWQWLDYYLGLANYNLNDYFSAINSMSDFINKIDTLVPAYMIRGNAYVQVEEFDAALQDYNKVLQLHPGDISALMQKANLSFAQHNFDAYINDLTEVLKIEPNNVEALTNRAMAYANKANWQPAIADLTTAINVKESSNLYFERAKANYSLKTKESFAAAIEDCNKAEALGTTELNLYTIRLSSNQELGNFEAAVNDYTKIIEIVGENINMYYGRGVAKYSMKDFKGAIADMDKVIEKDPKNINAYKLRATAKTQLKDTKGAQADAAKVKELQGGK
jgi:tetratricopeptide (TPR) repeat protein